MKADVSSDQSSEQGPTSNDRPWVSLAVGPVFLLLAVWFLWSGSELELPKHERVSFDSSVLTSAPRRVSLTDPPTVNIDGFDRTCQSCHRLFPTRADPPGPLLQHQHIYINHGINKSCLHCHDDQDRNLLVMRDGRTVGYDQVIELCAQCHGSKHRDWMRGAHGRTNEYWDASRGQPRKLGCTECHDPHHPRSPAMDPLVPLPGPNTLRMGQPLHASDHAHQEETALRDPLRWRSREADTPILHPDPVGRPELPPDEEFIEEEEGSHHG